VSAIIDLQIACQPNQSIPSQEDIQRWADLALTVSNDSEREITVRLVDTGESQQINGEYRDKPKPTNVLSFPFECPPQIELPLLGDLVICPVVVEAEAVEQSKQLQHHYAHLVIHGVLHLLGYDHIDPVQADEMESIETRLLAKLGIDDPYQDH
jgi:probable rRNA maturation factor